MTSSNVEVEIERLRKVMQDDVDSLRSLENYDVTFLDYPFGRRISLRPKQRISYEDLQGTRGLDVSQDMTPEMHFEKSMDPMNGIDEFRHKEIEILNKMSSSKILDPNLGFFEIGFRSAKIMNFYRDKFKSVSGCDVVKHSVNVASLGGYDVHQIDMNDPIGLNSLLENVHLIAAYQIFEHLFDPLESLKKLYDSMRPNSYLHIEVPTETGMPRVRYSHVYAFHPNDLREMLRICGFEIVSSSTQRHHMQPELQRCLVLKPS